MLYGFMKSLLHVIGQLKDKELLAFVARSLQHYTVFMIPFHKVSCTYWSSQSVTMTVAVLSSSNCYKRFNSSAQHSASRAYVA
jgi:hypothetical protein